jgi:hypothetical protein
MTDPEFTPEATYKFRVRRIALTDHQPNEWISVGRASDFDFYGNAAMKAIRDSLWYSDSIMMIEDIAGYPIAAYVNGMISYCWNQAPSTEYSPSVNIQRREQQATP